MRKRIPAISIVAVLALAVNALAADWFAQYRARAMMMSTAWNPGQDQAILARWTPASMQTSAGGYLTNWIDVCGTRNATPLVPNSLVVSGNAVGAFSGVWFPEGAANIGMSFSPGITNIDNATMFAVFSRPSTGITSMIIGSTNIASFPFSIGGSSRPNCWWGLNFLLPGYDQQVTNTGWYYCISSISNGVATSAYLRVNDRVISPLPIETTGTTANVSPMSTLGIRPLYSQCHYGYIVEVGYFSTYASESLLSNVLEYIERTYGEDAFR